MGIVGDLISHMDDVLNAYDFCHFETKIYETDIILRYGSLCNLKFIYITFKIQVHISQETQYISITTTDPMCSFVSLCQKYMTDFAQCNCELDKQAEKFGSSFMRIWRNSS